MKQKKKKNFQKKFKNGHLKNGIFQMANSQNNFVKILWIGPWVDAKGIDVDQPIWLCINHSNMAQ